MYIYLTLIILFFETIYVRPIFCAASSSSGPSSSASSSSTPSFSRLMQDPHVRFEVRKKTRKQRARAGRSLSPGIRHNQEEKSSRLSWGLPSSVATVSAGYAADAIRTDVETLFLPHDIVTPPGRGYATPHEVAIRMSAIDYLSKRTFAEHFQEDYERGLPWPVALFYYQRSDGALAFDIANGRTLYKYMCEKGFKHPTENLLLLGSPRYYLVERVDKKFEVEYAGTLVERKRITPEGIYLRGILHSDQNAAVWHQIGLTCYKLKECAEEKKADKAIEWFQRALAELQSADKDYGFILHAIADAYVKKDDPETALGWFKKAQMRYHEERKKNPDMLLAMGTLFERLGNIDQAFAYYQWAVRDSGLAMEPLIHILCLYAEHKDRLNSPAIIDDMKKNALQFTVTRSLPEGIGIFDVLRYAQACMAALELQDVQP